VPRLRIARGAVLTALALMSVASIAGRALFSRPLPGDYELVQTGCALFVALCLPYCQLKNANIIIDFFTAKATRRTQGRLDALGALLVGLVMLLIAWRTGAGLLSIRASGETTTILGMPTWWTYAACCPASCSLRWLPFEAPPDLPDDPVMTGLGVGLLLFGAMLVLMALRVPIAIAMFVPARSAMSCCRARRRC